MDRPSHRVILLSENVARFLLRGESYLSRSGFVLVVGVSGRDLLDLAGRERPAAAIIGYDLADIPGHEVCRRLKKSSSPPTAVLVVGPSQPPEASRRSREAGCDEYIPLPADPQSLLIRLASHLGVRFRLQPRRPLMIPVSHGRVIREFFGHTTDLGEGGVQIETVLKPRVGRRLLLRFYPDDRKALVLSAAVLRVRESDEEGQNLVALEFLPAPATERGRLKDLLGRRI